MKYRVLKVERLDDDWVIEIEEFRWLRKNRTRRFVGSCTVWYEVVNGRMKRCGTMREVMLTNIWEGARMREKHPGLFERDSGSKSP